MARYHLYFLKQGMLVGSDAIEAADDREAAQLASARSDGCTVEVWNASQRVRVIAPPQPAEAAAAPPFEGKRGL